MRIVLFSERLRSPYDEGIKNVASNLVRALAARDDLLALTSQGQDDAQLGLRNVDVNRMLVNRRLGQAIAAFRPQAVVYVPTACGTLFDFARARVLRSHAPGAIVALIALQPRPYTVWGRWCIRHLTPELAVAQSSRTAQTLADLGCRTSRLPPAVDAERFHPATPQEKVALRARYGIPREAVVVTHVGHLKGKRNLMQVLALQRTGAFSALVVASSSTEPEPGLKETLRAAGVMIIDGYVEHIAEVYHLSDVYLFLADEPTAAIEMPLSVLEAMACNLPVVTTPFGGLPDYFQEGSGLLYWRGSGDLAETVRTALAQPCATRGLVQARTWSAAASALVESLGVREVVP